ncbi:MAG TPA: hypothetical protein DEA26_04840 [Oceanospirillales bacterium]|nr:hypothetical protein [Oceanospirillaceae bacterium]HBS41984.1 hypothetical protein [Oceanospirillales bacterium]|tara:strand:+ start:1535 stop:2122 length:588 start_codon:yes stop_codon:yes gene_type:complete
MRNLFPLGLMAALTMILSGCVLAPQVIELDDTAAVAPPAESVSRGALVRVVDKRQVSEPDVIGLRGGRAAERSPLKAQDSLERVLTSKMQASLTQLGFGGNSPLAPLKVQLTVNQFDYLCNDGMWVNDCSMKVNMELNVIDGDKTFRKPFGASETRRVATAPVADYNQEWVNAMLENIWERMFSDPEFRAFVGVQ